MMVVPKTKSYTMTSEMLEMSDRMVAEAMLCDRLALIPFRARVARKSSIRYSRIRRAFWNLVYMEYPELRGKEVDANYIKAQLTIKREDDNNE